MNQLPLVSIVTPSYNQKKFLEDAMLSVIKQSYPNIEYFIVDGDSRDGSVEIIRDYSIRYSDRIRWWISEKDHGQAEAINKGFSQSTGEIIAWLNSDDLYLKDTIEKVVGFFNNHSEIGLLFSDVVSINSDDEIINMMRFRQSGLKDLLAFNIISQPGVFFRRNLLEKIGFLDERFHCLLDHQLWLRIANKTRIHYINDCLAAARFHQESKNIAQSARFSDEAFQLLEWIRSEQEFEEIYKRMQGRIESGAYRFSARYLLDAEDYAKALNHYCMSLRFHPPTALKEAHRMVYSFFSLFFSIKGIKEKYLEIRKNLINRDHPSRIEKWWLHG